MNCIWLGLTGNIGCGKTTVARMLESFGAAVVDADREAHMIAQEDAGYRKALTERFGDGLFQANGALDRPALANLLFDDPLALSDFNAMLQPRLVARTRAKLQALAATHSVVVLDGALIFEYGRQSDFKEVWLVTASPEIVNARMMAHGFTLEQIEKRRAAQWSEEVKKPLANRIIANDGSLEQLEAIVKRHWNELTLQCGQGRSA